MAETGTPLYRRHDLAWVGADAWTALMVERPDLAAVPLVADWADRGRPLVVRAAKPGDPQGHVPLGLPLPPSAGKLRLDVSLLLQAVERIGPPLLLADAVEQAPAAWRPALVRLIALDPQVRVYGSLAWTALTGLDYLSSGSDLDLLWSLEGAELRTRLSGLAAVAADAPMRIDGEIVDRTGAGVHWRELDKTTLLVRGPAGPTLVDRRFFLEGLT